MTSRQRFSFSVFSAEIDGAYGVDHMFSHESSARSDNSSPRGQASNPADDLPAFGKYCGSTSPVNGPIHSTSAQER